MSGCEHEGYLTPELEAEVVRQALAQGDLRHAAHHVCGILASDPLRPDHLELLEQVANEAGDQILEVYGLSEQPWYGEAAVHAWAVAREGRTARAMALLAQVAAVAPGTPYLAWARGWPLPPAEELQAVVQPILQIHHPDALRLAWDTILSRALERHPDVPMLGWASSIVMRKAGDPERAVELAESSLAAGVTWMGCVALANANKEAGNWEATCAAWEKALQVDPSDATVLLDWGDNLVDRHELDAASDRYTMALERDPGNAWAIGSLEWIQYLRGRDTAAWITLRNWVRAHPENGRGQAVLAQATPWWGRLPWPSEASMNGLYQALEQGTEVSSMATSHLECGSSQLAIRQIMPDAELSYGEIPSPDPREPRGAPSTVLFAWEGTTARPALGPPPPDIQARIERLAGLSYHADSWLRAARREVTGLGPEAVGQILAGAVNPGPCPSWCPQGVWLWRCQHAAAFLLTAFGGWDERALHVQALRSMASVRNDWTCTAAIAALTARARDDMAAEQTAKHVVLNVLAEPPDSGAFLTSEPAWWALLRLDPDDELGLAERAIRELDADE